jgi:hypothetical protein
VVISAPELAMNRALARADNAQLWLSLLRQLSLSGELAFDEFHHGFTHHRSLGEFASRYGLPLAAGQLVLGLCFWAFALRRFGPPRLSPQIFRVGSTDALFATSRLYREGGHHGHAAAQLVRGAYQQLASQLGLRASASGEEIVVALKSSGRSELLEAVKELEFLARTAKSESDVFALAQRAAAARHLSSNRSTTAP